MTFDPDRTTVLPPVGYPITEELPAVQPASRGRSGPFFLKLVGGLLVAGLIGIGIIFALAQQTGQDVATPADATAVATPVSEREQAAAPTPVQLEDTEPGFWQVVGVVDGLNIRSGPGTSTDIVGALTAGDRHVFGTGERATVNGAEWTQISFGDSDSTGWVSSRFLATDTPPDPNAPAPTAPPSPDTAASVVCFESQGAPSRVARLRFTDGTMISGLIRTIDGQVAIDQAVAGTLENGQADVTLTDASSDQVVRQTWDFSPASVDLGNGTVMVVTDCNAVGGQLP